MNTATKISQSGPIGSRQPRSPRPLPAVVGGIVVMCISATVAMVGAHSTTEAVGNATLHGIVKPMVYARYCDEKAHGDPESVIEASGESLQGVKIKEFVNPRTGQVIPYAGNGLPCGDWFPVFDQTADDDAIAKATTVTRTAEVTFAIAAVLSLGSLFSSRKKS